LCSDDIPIKANYAAANSGSRARPPIPYELSDLCHKATAAVLRISAMPLQISQYVIAQTSRQNAETHASIRPTSVLDSASASFIILGQRLNVVTPDFVLFGWSDAINLLYSGQILFTT
jgi:hypothetical protein